MGDLQSARERQKMIYTSGFAGMRQTIPVNFQMLESLAMGKMSKRAFAYVAGGAGRGSTVDANGKALDRIKIVPRVYHNVSDRDMHVHCLGMELPSPLLLGPVGVLELAHRDGDIAVARAAAQLGVPMIFSNQASHTMEACAEVMGGGPRWFQLYRSKSDDLTISFLRRAEACGCSAIVVTLDTSMLGWRTHDLDLGYLPFLEGRGLAQYHSDPVFNRMVDEYTEPEEGNEGRKVTLAALWNLIKMTGRYPRDGFFTSLRSGRPIKAVRTFIENYSGESFTWDDVGFLKAHTQLPILLKGILSSDDARNAVDHGASGIIVSNHGGRQVDGAIASAEALPGIVLAVQGEVPVFFDSGIRGGADIFKALALGASAVCIGRPYVYGLAVAGQPGVEEVIRNLLAEFELTMALSGCCSIAEIDGSMVISSGHEYL